MTGLTLLAHDVGPTGGMERVWWEILQRLPEHSARLLTAGEPLDERPASVATWQRIRAPGRPFSLKFPLFYRSSARVVTGGRNRALTVAMGAISAAPVDVAHVHFCHAGFQALGVPRQTGSYLRRINTGAAGKMALAAERACYRPGRVRALAAVSQGVADELRAHFPGVPVRVVPNGIDLDRFRPHPAARRHVRDQLGFPPATALVLFVGGEWERKGLHLALEALARLPPASDVRLVVVGKGETKRYWSIARSAGVADRVSFIGRQTDVAPWYQAADVLVHPSLYETFSLAAHEAAACGLPVIATPVHGVHDLVGDDEAGVVVDRRAESVAAVLERLVADRALLARLGAAARRRASKYTWERTTRAFLDVVAEASEMREHEGE